MSSRIRQTLRSTDTDRQTDGQCKQNLPSQKRARINHFRLTSRKTRINIQSRVWEFPLMPRLVKQWVGTRGVSWFMKGLVLSSSNVMRSNVMRYEKGKLEWIRRKKGTWNKRKSQKLGRIREWNATKVENESGKKNNWKPNLWMEG